MSRKFTIEEVREVVESKGYELLSEEYINNQSRLKIKDNYGYKFKISLNSLKSGTKPLAFSSLNPYVLDNIQLLIDSKLDSYKLITTKYKGKKYPIVLKDTYDYHYTTYVSTLRNGSKPTMCDPSNSYSIENIKKWLVLNNKKIEIISNEYKTMQTKMKWKCTDNKCGHIFETSFYYFYYYGSGCPFCVNQKIGLANCLATKNPELAKEWYSIGNGDLTPHDVSEHYKYSVWWQCSKNKNHIWKNKVKYRNEGFGCPYCNKSRASEEYNLLIDNPQLCKEWDYSKNKLKPTDYTPYSKKKVWWKCDKCEKSWKADISNRNNQDSLCSCGKFISKGERKIKEFLDLHNIDYKSQYKFDNCRDKLPLPFDFYFPELEKMCEYNGSQHYEPHDYFGGESRFKIQQKHDQIKRDYCKENDIKLIEIPYWDFDNIEEILTRELGLDVDSVVNT